jgi:hypothetical protein
MRILGSLVVVREIRLLILEVLQVVRWDYLQPRLLCSVVLTALSMVLLF